MSPHTPGPWTCDVVVDGRSSITAAESIIQPTYAINCSGHAWPQVARAEAFANARLIAAAPELLEAAKHATMEWRLHGQLTDSCRVLEAAIAKAEGR